MRSRSEGWGDQEHAGRHGVEHLGEAVEHAHREGVPEGVQQPPLHDHAPTPAQPWRREARSGSGPADPEPVAAARTRSAVAAATGPLPLKASEAVEVDTPACSATSRSVARA